MPRGLHMIVPVNIELTYLFTVIFLPDDSFETLQHYGMLSPVHNENRDLKTWINEWINKAHPLWEPCERYCI